MEITKIPFVKRVEIKDFGITPSIDKSSNIRYDNNYHYQDIYNHEQEIETEGSDY